MKMSPLHDSLNSPPQSSRMLTNVQSSAVVSQATRIQYQRALIIHMQNPPTMSLSSRRGVGSPASLAPLVTFNPDRKDSHEQFGSLLTGNDGELLPTPSSTQSWMASRLNRLVRRTRTQGELNQVEASEPRRSASLPYSRPVHPSTTHSQLLPFNADPTLFSEPPSVIVSPELPSEPRRDLNVSNGIIISATLDVLMACIMNEGK
jgi:hypothetical protein